ncbi:MAG: YdcH family protein [Pseudochelatococcus sp.]|uniref:YdcH family protein n=1 Tax=Pseudochelatococcus sp. TaxID=2020869 RepID=UPI003D94A869
MSLEGHLVELERRHQAIEREIKTYLARPSSNSEQIIELKRRKLQLKDEIERLHSQKARRKLN